MFAPRPSLFVMVAVVLALGFYLIYPLLLLVVYSFNVAPEVFVGTPQWGLDNWRTAFQRPGVLESIGNSFLIWGLTLGISLPAGVVIAWLLARTHIPWSDGLEFMFWISYIIPNLATTIGWISLMDPEVGALNQLARALPGVERGPFNIFSVPGIVWAHLMGNGISLKVILLTPAFRNMDASLEEAARVGGASNLRTMLRVTVPLMIAPITLVFALQLLRVFQGFETELLLGTPIKFFVYSTFIYDLLARGAVPQYGQAIVLASITMGIIALIVPLQRWIISRRQYTTLAAGFRPGLIDLGPWKLPVFCAIGFLVFLFTLLPLASLVIGSFMSRAGFFDLNPVFTMAHWNSVLTNRLFVRALTTTLVLGCIAALISPLIFSLLAYILVRTRWPLRGALEWIIWSAGVMPGILAGLGLLILFLGTRGLSVLFGTIWALVLVVIFSGITTGTNIMKGTLVQVGQELEDAARTSGAGWVRTYVQIWIPLMIRTLLLLAMMNFVSATGATSSIILLASRDTTTLSILALHYRTAAFNQEAASVVAIVLLALTIGMASLMRALGLNWAVRQV